MDSREDGLYSVIAVFDGKPYVGKVVPGWRVLFRDEHGVKRFGFVRNIDATAQVLVIKDDTTSASYYDLLNAPVETIPFSAVLAAGNGYTGFWKTPIYQGGKKLGMRNVRVLIEGSEATTSIGFIKRKQGGMYVDLIDGKWCLR